MTAAVREDVWLVRTPLAMIVVEGAHTVKEAREKALVKLKLDHKPYLAREWEIQRLSTVDAELRRAIEAQMDGYRKSQPTAVTAKAAARAQKTPSQRLRPKPPKDTGQGSMF